MDFATIHSVWTLFIFLIFAVIALWAFAPSRKASMDEAGRSILEEDDAPSARNHKP